MALTAKTSKKQKIYKILEDDILNNVLKPGSRLSSRRDMAAQFGCSDTVINEVCNLLEERKLIVRKPKSGTFVNPQLEFGTSRLMVLVVSMATDNFENYIETFLQAAQQAMMLPMICRVTPANVSSVLNRIRKRSPERILLDLEAKFFPMELIESLLDTTFHLFVNRWEWDDDPFCAVITDYVSAYMEGLNYLRRDCGAKKILFINSHKYLMPHQQKVMEEIYRKSGMQPEQDLILYSFQEMQREPQQLQALIERTQPDGIASVSDYYLTVLMNTAEKYCPEVLSLPKVGTLDMTYSSFPGHEFPSVPLDLKTMWETAMAYPENQHTARYIPAQTVKIKGDNKTIL